MSEIVGPPPYEAAERINFANPEWANFVRETAMTVERLGIGEDRLDTVFRKMTMLDDFDHADLVSLAKRYGIKRDGVQPYDLKWLCKYSGVVDCL